MKQHKKNSLLVLLLFFTANAFGENVLKETIHPVDSVLSFVKNYTDSLYNYKNRLDSLWLLNSSRHQFANPIDGRYARLFTPMTFYHSISQHQFGLEEETNTNDMLDEMLEKALIHIYLNRPNLVTKTQTQLNSVKQAVTSQTTTIKTQTDIVDKVAPTPVEANFIPIDVVVKKPNFWKFSGDGRLQFYQNYVSGNWDRGGESNYAVHSNITLVANYNNKQKVRWDNKIELKLGFQTSRGDTLRHLKPSMDEVRYTSSLGLQATKRWYYTLALVGYTQTMRGYKNNDDRVYSDFLSPLNVTLSLGMDYRINWLKGRLTGGIHLAPLAYNYRYVDRESLVKRFGIEEGKHHIDDYGSEMKIDMVWKISEAIRWKSRLYGYTSYKRVLGEWENTITFQLTKYLTSDFYIYPRFDDSRARDDHHGYFMFKEYLSLGLAYSF